MIPDKYVAPFWAKVDRRGPDECWPWIGGTVDSDGYGMMKIRPVPAVPKIWFAHRMAYWIGKQPFDLSLFICHSCDNPPCCNPNHLFTGRPKDNSDDMVRKGRSASGDRSSSRLYPERLARGDRNWTRRYPEKVARGVNHPCAKLTESEVIEARAIFAVGDFNSDQLARKFGLAKSSMRSLLNRKTWRHIP